MDQQLTILMDLLKSPDVEWTTRKAVDALQARGIRMADASETLLEAVEEGRVKVEPGYRLRLLSPA